MKNAAIALVAAGILGGFTAASGAGSTSMQAMVSVGGRLEAASVPVPDPQSDQVRIRVRAASVNPVDWKLAERASPGSREVPGKDCSGIIDAVGAGVSSWHSGDAVIAITASGAYAGYALASARAVAAKPARMSFSEAAGIPVVGESAWRALVVVADVHPGERVLIHGAAGGVGSAAVQLAKARGAYVIATASANNRDYLRSLGADEVIDYHAVRFEDQVHQMDVVVNTVDADTGLRSLRVLRPGGVLVSLVGPTSPAQCAAARVRCEGIGHVTGEYLAPLVALADSGKLRISIDRELPLSDAQAAWDLSRQHHVRGKIILNVSH